MFKIILMINNTYNTNKLILLLEKLINIINNYSIKYTNNFVN